MLLHVYGSEAFRSELCLFRAHRVPAVEAEPVEVDDSAHHLFRVEFERGFQFTTEGERAHEMFFREGGYRLTELAIV